MDDIRIYSVSEEYISFLRTDPKLNKIFDNKIDTRSHTRKYLGAVFTQGDFRYFVPFSSPKNSDYIVLSNGTRNIRKSIIPIIRMTTNDTVSGKKELKGTLKLSNMIPVPESELTPYDISQEKDTKYRQVVQKEWNYIRSNMSKIVKNAKVLYNQKTKCNTMFAGTNAPGYLANTLDFKYVEQKCIEFQSFSTENILSETH